MNGLPVNVPLEAVQAWAAALTVGDEVKARTALCSTVGRTPTGPSAELYLAAGQTVPVLAVQPSEGSFSGVVIRVPVLFGEPCWYDAAWFYPEFYPEFT